MSRAARKHEYQEVELRDEGVNGGVLVIDGREFVFDSPKEGAETIRANLPERHPLRDALLRDVRGFALSTRKDPLITMEGSKTLQ